jgi:hypothetical protein
MGLSGEVVTKIAEGGFDGAENLVVGEIDQFIGQAFEEVVGLSTQGLKELPTPLFAPFRDRVSGRGGFVQHGNLPGVRPTEARCGGSFFP